MGSDRAYGGESGFGSQSRLIGRDAELDTFREMLAEEPRVRPRTLFVFGEAGIGKSRLINEFSRLVEENPGTIVQGSCPPLSDAFIPFAAVTEALRPYFRSPDQITALSDLRILEVALDQAFSRLEASSRDIGEEERRTSAQGGLFESFLRLIEDTADRGLVALIVEDIHWADSSTLALLTHFIWNVRHPNAMIVLTCRSDELPAKHPVRRFVSELLRSKRAESMELGRFGRREITAHLTTLQGVRPSRATVDRVTEASEGVPLFVEDLVSHRGLGFGSVQDGWLARMQGMAQESQRVLQIAAVGGKRIAFDLLKGVSGLSDELLSSGIREAVGANFLVTDNHNQTLVFSHELRRQVVYQDLLPSQRVSLHDAVATFLETHPNVAIGSAAGAAAELAYHWTEAANPMGAFSASLAAAHSAERMYAFSEALVHFERAVELWDRVADPETTAGLDRVELLKRTAEAAFLDDNVRRAIAWAEAAIEIVGDETSSRAAILFERYGQYLWDHGQGEKALEARQHAVERMPTEPLSVELARVLAAQAQILLLLYRNDESQEICRRALEVATAVGATREEGHARATLGSALIVQGELAQGLDQLRDAREIAVEKKDPSDIERAHNNLARGFEFAGDLMSAVAEYQAGIEDLKILGLKDSGGQWLRCNMAGVLIKLGRLDDAEALTLEPVPPSQSLAAMWDIARGQIALVRGRFEEAKEFLSQAHQVAVDASDAELVAITSCSLAEAEFWQGTLEQGRAIVGEALPRISGSGEMFETARLLLIGVRLEAAHGRRLRIAHGKPDRGSIGRCNRMLQRFEDCRDSGEPLFPNFPEVDACKASAAAEAARAEGDVPPELWAEASKRWRALNQPWEGAYALWREGEARLAVGQRVEAQTVLQTAHELSEGLGAGALLSEIERVVSSARLRVHAPLSVGGTRNPTVVLTRRETEVLAALAHGMTNPQIATTLHVTPSTIEQHVSNILRKLDARSRDEAVSHAHELGLI